MTLPNGEKVKIPKAFVSFDAKTVNVIPYTFGGEAVLYKDEEIYVELKILRMLRDDAWSGVSLGTRVAINSYKAYKEVARERDELLQ